MHGTGAISLERTALEGGDFERVKARGFEIGNFKNFRDRGVLGYMNEKETLKKKRRKRSRIEDSD
jgi:hypothetical protein